MERTGSRPIDELVRLAVIGDGTAFTALWDTYIDSLKVYIQTKMKGLDEMQVEEICCWSFEKAFRHIKDYDSSRSQFFTWLCSIAWNTGLDLMEREQRAHPRGQTIWIDDASSAASMFDNIPDQVDTPLESIINDETQEETLKYISALPVLYRDIAKRRLIDGLQYKEIAKEMDMELNTVRTRIRRAKAMIEELRANSEQ